MFCSKAMTVPKPDKAMKIHATTVTNVDFARFSFTPFPPESRL
jgi:hypothetical protein